MTLGEELVREMELLLMYDLSNTQTGLKVHSSSASSDMVAAAQRLFDKKIIDQADGGYLTHLGREVAEHLQASQRILTS